MNVIDFIRESAAYMAKDRPDVYESPDFAVRELSQAIEVLRQHDLPYACVMFTSYLMGRTVEDGVEEFLLTRKLSSAIVCEEEEACLVFSHDPQVNLPSINGPSDQDEEALDDDDESW